MDARDRELSEAVLRHLLLGAQISEVRIAPYLQEVVADRRQQDSQAILPRQSYLKVESAWMLFPDRPGRFPVTEADVPTQEAAEQERALRSLRGRAIQGVELGEEFPHLLLTLEDGRVFFVCGNNDLYESWQCGSVDHNQDSFWLVVATPGGGLAIWEPADFP